MMQENVGVEDAVVRESSSGSFWWAQRIQGSRCLAIDPYRFRIIRDSLHKTDRRDAVALSLPLWMSAQSGELVRYDLTEWCLAGDSTTGPPSPQRAASRAEFNVQRRSHECTGTPA